MREFLKYSQTSPQWPPQGQKKEAVVEGGRYGEVQCRDVIQQFFLREYNMLLVLCLCLMSPTIVIIQS